MEGTSTPSGETPDAERRRSIAARLALRPLREEDLAVTVDMHLEHLPNGLFPALGSAFLRTWHGTFLRTDKAAGAVIEDPAEQEIAGYLLLSVDPPRHAEEIIGRYRNVLMRHGVVGLARNPRLALYFARTRAQKYLAKLARLGRPSRPEQTADHQPADPGISTPAVDRSQPTVEHGAGDRTSEQASPQTAEHGADPEPERLAVVHAVITRPDYQGMGVARRLLDWAAEESTSADATGIALVTDIGVEPGTRSPLVAEDGSGQGAAGLYDRLGWHRHAVRQRDGRVLQEFRIDLPAQEKLQEEPAPEPATQRPVSSAGGQSDTRSDTETDTHPHSPDSQPRHV